MFVTRDDLIEDFLVAEAHYEAENMSDAINILEALSEKGMPEATRKLAFIYLTGDGIESDEIKAQGLYEKSIDQLKFLSVKGNGIASILLGKIYQYGNKTEVNFEEAIQFFTTAIVQGNSEAMLKMAHIYKYGWCAQNQSPEKYLYYLNMAAKNFEPEALFEKGLLISDKNPQESLRLIVEASKLGFYPAIEYLENN